MDTEGGGGVGEEDRSILKSEGGRAEGGSGMRYTEGERREEEQSKRSLKRRCMM